MELADLKKLVAEQAEDEALWFDAVYVTESILQQSLRRLHDGVERFIAAHPELLEED